MRPELSVVIVSYRSRDVLGPCLDSLALARAEIALEVIVVDNASGDGTAEDVRIAYPWVAVIDAPENRGYGAGLNLGVRRANGKTLLLLNPDCSVPPGSLATLAAALHAAPRAAVVAPALVDEAGRIARSCGRFPTLWTLACEHLGIASLFPGVPLLCGSKLTAGALARATRVDWASGAALLVRADAWDEIGPFDEAIFLYMEEVDWCLRAARAGWETRFVPAARVLHLGQRSSRQAPVASYVHNLESRIHYMTKHRGAFAAAATRAILGLSLGLKWAVARLAPGRAANAAMYLAGLRAITATRARAFRPALAALAIGTLAVVAVGGGHGPQASASASLASSPRAPGPTRLAYFYQYMPFSHVDSLAQAGFDGAIVHSLADSTDAREATRIAGFRTRGNAVGVEVIPQWALQQASRLGTRRYTWGRGNVEPDIACPLDSAYWRSAFLDRAEEILAADRGARAIAVDLEFHQGSLHHYDAGACRCSQCVAEYLGPTAAGAVDPAALSGLFGWEEARVAAIVGALADTLAARHPGLEIGVFDLDLDSFVHRGVGRGLAQSPLAVCDYSERSYSSGVSALGGARSRLDALGLSRARLVGGIWLKRFDPDAAARTAQEIRTLSDGHFVFTTYSLWLDPRELAGPYMLAGAPGDYWRAFRKVQATP